MGRAVTVGIKRMTREELNAYHRVKQAEYRKIRASHPRPAPPPKSPLIICPDCERMLPRSPEYFYFGKQGCSHVCKPCTNKRRRAWTIAKNFHMTMEEYQTKLRGARCEICSRTDDLVMDHSHVLKIPRGVLCQQCNMVLGRVYDRVDLLQAAIDYLKRYHA